MAPSLAQAALLLLLAPARRSAAQESPEPIADNSFLIEEAYNQEPGVVQHISNFARPEGGDAWDFGFTQEWPLGGMRHQLSYTVPSSTPTAAAPGSATSCSTTATSSSA